MKERKKTTGHLMEPKKGQKQGREERTQEDYWTSDGAEKGTETRQR